MEKEPVKFTARDTLRNYQSLFGGSGIAGILRPPGSAKWTLPKVPEPPVSNPPPPPAATWRMVRPTYFLIGVELDGLRWYHAAEAGLKGLALDVRRVTYHDAGPLPLYAHARNLVDVELDRLYRYARGRGAGRLRALALALGVCWVSLRAQRGLLKRWTRRGWYRP